MLRNLFLRCSNLLTSRAFATRKSLSAEELSTTEEQPILEPAMKKMKKNHAGTPFQWLRSLPGFSTMPRQRPRRLAKVTFSHRLDRDEAMGICYTHFDELLSAYESPDPRRLTPIIATAISPIGSGKSFFLDEVGELRPVDVDKFCKSKWAPALKSAVTISISFSGFSNVENAADRDDRALCARMLYSYFHSILPDAMGFREFFAKFDMSDVSLAACIEFIVSHFDSAPAAASATDEVEASSDSDKVPSTSSSGPVLVLLLVDELAKSKCEDEILSAVGSILDESPRLADGRKCLVLPVFTSLHEKKLTELQTGSQRAIMKVPLCVALTSAPAALKTLLAVPPELHPLIDVLCQDAGCHGRMLEAIVELLHPSTDLRNSMNTFIRTPFRMLPSIHADLDQHSCSAELFREITKAPHILIDAVCHVLLGHTVPRNAKVMPVVPDLKVELSVDAASEIGQLPMSQWTYDYLLSRGVFIADAGTSTRVITPVMSPLQLDRWASTLHRSAGKDLSPQMKLFLQAIRRTFLASTRHNQETFEDFHQDVEFIRRFALRRLGVRELTPIEYFKLDDSDYGGALPKNPAASLQTRMNLGADSDLSRAKVNVSNADVNNAIITQFQSGAKSTIELAVEGQKLFDIRITQPALNEKRNLCIFEQLRLSDDYYHRKAKEDDEIRKPQWMKEIQSQSQRTPGWRDAVFVYIAARRIRDWEQIDCVHPDNVILLSPDNLARYYGPTIMGANAMTTTTGSHCD